MYLNQSFNDVKKCRAEMFEHKNALIALELSTVFLGIYFAIVAICTIVAICAVRAI